MKKENEALLNELTDMMKRDVYPINAPINQNFLDSMMRKNVSSTNTELESISNDLALFLVAQPDYVDFLERMDGFEYDGLILYSFSVKAETDNTPPPNNIFLYNDNFRNNDIYVNSDLSERVVIGQDNLSFFTYDIKENVYQIRDNVGTEKIYGSFDNFTDFLAEILDTVR